MGYGLLPELLWTSLVLTLVCAWIAARDLPLGAALVIAMIRVGVCCGYFAWYYDGTWTFQDDLVYTDQGQYLVSSGYDPLTILSPDGIEKLESIAGSQHVLYTWWNLAAMWLIGEFYFAPVLLNVLVTFVVAWVLGRTLAELEFPKAYRAMLIGFFLLHWDTIAWSSFINLKDCLVQLMTCGVFWMLTRMIVHRDFKAALAALAITGMFSTVRFYLPGLIVMACGIWLFFEWHEATKFLVLTLCGIAAVLVAPWHHVADSLNPLQLFHGSLRFLLTPQPWNIRPAYSFLNVPAVLHWVTIIPTAIGFGILCLRYKFARLMLWYGLLVIVFYAAVDELQGVRHRVQIYHLFAWGQFHLAWSCLYSPAAAGSSISTSPKIPVATTA